MRGIDHADPLQRHHPHHAHLPRHPTQDTTTATHQHTRQRQARATPQPLQARMTCAARTPPPEATGAHLSALQPTPKPAHTHNRQAVREPYMHAPPHRRDHHHQPSQHQPPRPPAATTTTTTVTTARDDMSTNRSSTNSAQCSDQRKHQTSRWRNNHQPKNLPQTPQEIPRGGARADRARLAPAERVQV